MALIWFKLVLQDVMEQLVPYLEQDIFLVEEEEVHLLVVLEVLEEVD
tara:strand:+ start:229 stop:369 length:141 start_codon:yes stop_codon:yes gene_type:complete